LLASRSRTHRATHRYGRRADADLVATLRWGAEWDIAAAALIATEAGARVTDALGLPLVFNKPSPQRSACWQARQGLHRAAVAHLAERRNAGERGLAYASSLYFISRYRPRV
jgi:hypothetical protein